MITIDSSKNLFVVNDGETPGAATPPYYNIFTPLGFQLKFEIIKKTMLSGKPPFALDYTETIVEETRIPVNPWTYWNNDEKLESIRLQRNYLLSQTDWTALNDVPLSPSEKTAYENYRQQLRDFPDVVDVNLPIEQIIWPSKP